MSDTTLRRLRDGLFAVATLSLGGTGARPIAVDRQSSLTQPQVAPRASRDTLPIAVPGECDSLQPPAANKLALHLYASGVQIYRWSGAAWTFVAPEAVLSADADGKSKVGTHYAGPTWESVGGSKVVAAVARRCTPDATAIAWLSLSATSTEGPGIFRRITFIQRAHTVGGVAPSAPGTFVGEKARVPYRAEYFFYRRA